MTASPVRSFFKRMRALRAPVLLAGAMLLAARPGFAEALGRASDSDISLWRVASALLLCLLLAVAAGFVLRARQGFASPISFISSAPRRLRIVEMLRLGPKTALSIVTCDGQELLLLTSEQGGTILDRLPLPNRGNRPGDTP